jgi:hypothetical protein
MNSESTARTQSEPFTPNGSGEVEASRQGKRVPIMLKLNWCGGIVYCGRKTTKPRIPECPADVERAGRQMGRPKIATEPRALRVPEAMERAAQRRGRREQKRLSCSCEPEQKSPPGLGAIRITRGYRRIESEPSLLRALVETVRSDLPEGAVYYE